MARPHVVCVAVSQMEVHALYMQLMTDTHFREQFTDAFARTYSGRSIEFARGVGTRANALSEFSVQLFTSAYLVERVATRHSLLLSLAVSLSTVFGLASPSPSAPLKLDARSVAYERYVSVPLCLCPCVCVRVSVSVCLCAREQGVLRLTLG